MKKGIIKFIAIQQIVITLIMSCSLLFSVAQTVSTASNDINWEKFSNPLYFKEITKSSKKHFGVYIETDDMGKANGDLIYEGLRVYVVPIDEDAKEIEKFRVVYYDNNNITRMVIPESRMGTSEKITRSMCNDWNFSGKIKLVIEEIKSNKEPKEIDTVSLDVRPIRIYVEEPTNIKDAWEKSYYSGGGKDIGYDEVYIKPNSSIMVYGNPQISSISIDNANINSGEIVLGEFKNYGRRYITAGNVEIGTVGKVTFDGSLKTNIIVSNCAANSCKIYNTNVENVNEIHRAAGEDYKTVKKIGVKQDNTTFQVKSICAFADVDVIANYLEIKPIDNNTLNGSARVENNGSYYNVSLNVKNSGVVRATFKNYKNEYVTEYWYLYKNISETVKLVDKTKIDETEYEDGNGNNGGSAINEKEKEQTPPEPVYAKPSIKGNSLIDGGTITFTGTIKNCDEAKYVIVPKGTRISTGLSYSELPGISEVSDENGRVNFKCESIDTSNYRFSVNSDEMMPNDYKIYIIARNGTDYNYKIEPYNSFFDLGYESPETSFIANKVDGKLIVSGEIENNRESKCVFVKQGAKLPKVYSKMKGDIIKVESNGNFNLKYDISSFENGIYDIWIICLDSNESWKGWGLLECSLGKKYDHVSPSITSESSKYIQISNNKKTEMSYINAIDSENSMSNIEIPYTIKNCTKVKWKAIKRKDEDVAYDFTAETYKDFSGEELINPNGENSDFTITAKINANLTGSGEYDIAIWAINSEEEFYDTLIEGPIGCYESPNIEANYISNSSTQRKEYKVSATLCKGEDSDIVERYYYIHKKNKVGEKTNWNNDVITGKNSKLNENDIQGTFENGKSIILDMKDIGPGAYDLIIYAKTNEDRISKKEIKDIVISNEPVITHKIEDKKENEGYITYNPSPSVDIKVDDNDENDEIKVVTLVDTSDKLDEKLYQVLDVKYRTKLYETIRPGESITINVEPTRGEIANKYVYILAEDKYGTRTIKRTNSICVDGTDLQLQRVFADKEIQEEKVGYGLNQEFKLTLQFNRYIDGSQLDKLPDVYLKFGTYETKQNAGITVEKNMVTYHYKISSAFGNGDITLGRIDYKTNNVFKDLYGGAYAKTFKKQFAEVREDIVNEVEGYYFADTVKPKIQSIEYQITTNEESKVYDDETNHIKYISNPSNVNVVINYDEQIYNNGPVVTWKKGEKALISEKTQEVEERTRDSYDITYDVNATDTEESEYNFQGGVEVYKIEKANGTNYAIDKAGNEIDYSNRTNVKYKVNGQELTNATVKFDNSVCRSQLYASNKKVNGEAYLKGTTFQLFKEYEGNNTYDCSGIDTIDFVIYYNEAVSVLDKNGQELEPSVVSNGGLGYSNNALYNLTENELPISFTCNEVGDYLINSIKRDKLGNRASKQATLKITSDFTIDKENSGLSSELNEPFNTSKSSREYTLKLKLNTDKTENDIDVYYVDNISKEKLTFVKTEIVEGIKYAEYKFNINRGGKLYFKAIRAGGDINSKDVEEYFYDYTEVQNMYIPGDMNFDGTISMDDITCILKYLAGLELYTTNASLYAGDVNGDGNCTVADAVLLARVLAEDTGVHKTDDGHYKSGKAN